MSLTFYYLFSQTVFGCLALTPLVPFQVFGGGFFRSNALIFFLMLSGACAFLPVPAAGEAARWIEFACFHASLTALGLYNVSLWLRRERPALPLVWTATVLGGAAMVAGGFACPVELAQPWMRPALSVLFIVNAWATGGALMGMLVGHWYLMKPTLPFEPLIRLSKVFAAGAVAALVCVAATQASELAGGSASGIALAWSPASLQDAFVWVRLLVGTLAPVALAYMIVESARLRANMSATGLFYVAFAMRAAGDLMAGALLLTRALLV